jgi:signal-transduction protein with cAMP-binding, CBS, and nucleotidyltransferase domain
MKEEYYMPNQIIIQESQWQEPKMYLVLKGNVQVFQDRKKGG